MRPPTHQMAAARPTAAMTSMSGDENERTRAMRRSNLSRASFASAKRSDSHPSAQNDWITRIPATASRATSEMWPSVATELAGRLAEPLRDADDRDERRGDRAEGDERELPVEDEAVHEHHDHREPVAQVGGDGLGDRELHHLDVGGEAAEEVARVVLRVEARRQPHELVEQRAAQVGDHPLRRRGHEVRLPEVGDPLHDGDDHDHRRAGWRASAAGPPCRGTPRRRASAAGPSRARRRRTSGR